MGLGDKSPGAWGGAPELFFIVFFAESGGIF
jgi:hypothetical protein